MILQTWKERAKQLRREVYAVYLAYRDPRTPWYAKALIVVIVGYALSPIDLIPDFIPILGYVDDFILIPAGIYLALKMIPKEVMNECKEKATTTRATGKLGWITAVIIVSVWLLILYFVIRLIWSIVF
ncbi:YkvA family protein [Chloroflexota bacterium]